MQDLLELFTLLYCRSYSSKGFNYSVVEEYFYPLLEDLTCSVNVLVGEVITGDL